MCHVYLQGGEVGLPSLWLRLELCTGVECGEEGGRGAVGQEGGRGSVGECGQCGQTRLLVLRKLAHWHSSLSRWGSQGDCH